MMRSIDPAALDRRQRHLLLTSLIVPRPIALVSTMDERGIANLAPFSFFNGVASSPPVISLSIAQRGGGDKDTLANIKLTGELVVMVATEGLAEAVNQASADYPPEVSEIEACGLTAVPSELVRPPRLAESPVALEASLVHIVEAPAGAAVSVVLAEVLRYQIDEGVLGEDGTADVLRLAPLARLGGAAYGKVGGVFELERPRLD